MKIQEIDTVCFVGAGTMGCFNALMSAVAGYRAVIYDISVDALNQAPHTLKEMSGLLVEQGFFPAHVIPDALSRITFDADLSAATADADLVSESVSERLEIKREVHRRLDTVCDSNTLITTNTSSLLVSQIEDALIHGERFAALHSHLGSILIDIVGGPRTSSHTIDVLERYVVSIKGLPLVLQKENPGYVFNAIMGPFLTTAKMLVIEGIATLEDVDRAWMRYQQAPIGPFGLMDLFGLNIIFDSWHESKPGRTQLQGKMLGFITPYIENNTLGVKTGEGFYTYPQPLYQQAGFLEARGDLFAIHQTLVSVIISNAVVIASNSVAQPHEIDRAWIASMSLERGPFGALDEMGIDRFVKSCPGLLVNGLLPGELADRVGAYLQPYIESKTLGEKSGKGFYEYPDPEFRSPDFIARR